MKSGSTFSKTFHSPLFNSFICSALIVFFNFIILIANNIGSISTDEIIRTSLESLIILIVINNFNHIFNIIFDKEFFL